MTIRDSRSNLVALVKDPDTGELIRTDTGEVLFNNISSQEKEWRAFGSEEDRDRARTGAPTSLAFHDMGLSTIIGKENTDAAGNPISPSAQIRMGRLRMWNSRSTRRSSDCRHVGSVIEMLCGVFLAFTSRSYIEASFL